MGIIRPVKMDSSRGREGRDDGLNPHASSVTISKTRTTFSYLESDEFGKGFAVCSALAVLPLYCGSGSGYLGIRKLV